MITFWLNKKDDNCVCMKAKIDWRVCSDLHAFGLSNIKFWTEVVRSYYISESFVSTLRIRAKWLIEIRDWDNRRNRLSQRVAFGENCSYGLIYTHGTVAAVLWRETFIPVRIALFSVKSVGRSFHPRNCDWVFPSHALKTNNRLRQRLVDFCYQSIRLGESGVVRYGLKWVKPSLWYDRAIDISP